MIRAALLIFVVLLLQACATCETKIIKVPVIIESPQPPEVVRPVLEIDRLDKSNLQFDTLNKALQITIEQLKQYSIELETYLDVYRKKDK